MVFGNGPNAGAPLVAHPDVPLVSFTGGTATGQVIYKTCAALNKKMSLELGGKNACIVFEDADLEDALVTVARSCFANQGTCAFGNSSRGQICLCSSRIYVHASIYDQFLAGLKAKAEAIIVGDPFDPQTQMGPLVSAPHLEKVLSFVRLAAEEGGTIVTGGQRLESGIYKGGYYMRPTIISGVHPIDCRLQQEEIFGPVVTISSFDSEDQVIQYANGTKYGLSACVWTQNLKRAHCVSRQLQVNSVFLMTGGNYLGQLLDGKRSQYAFWRCQGLRTRS